jgi:hypothetical protein
MTEELNRLLCMQSGSGAFHSRVYFRSETEDDWNGFTTALVLRELAPLPASNALGRARERALDFLEQCESRNRPGCFAFWPRDRWPHWIVSFPEDADDTSVMVSELLRHGRLTIAQAREIVDAVLVSDRLADSVTPLRSPWLRPGVFLTWLAQDTGDNPVDCCVNTNVVGLMAQLHLNEAPGYQEACEMLIDAAKWADGSWERVSALSPFYPHPFELIHALQHAIELGAEPLTSALERLQGLVRQPAPENTLLDSRAPVFSTGDRTMIWTSDAIEYARSLRNTFFEHERVKAALKRKS